MFEQTSRLAEKVATSVSRRRFLGALGRWAGAAAMGLGGLLGLPERAWANNDVCCSYNDPNGPLCLTLDSGNCDKAPCPSTYQGYYLLYCSKGACNSYCDGVRRLVTASK